MSATPLNEPQDSHPVKAGRGNDRSDSGVALQQSDAPPLLPLEALSCCVSHPPFSVGERPHVEQC